MQLGSSLRAVTGSRFVDIAPWPRGTGAGKSMHSYVGSGSDLVDFSEGVSIFS